MENKPVIQTQIIENKIYEIRGQRVMLDFDLAELYEVETRVLKQAVKRNIEVFPVDFMFALTKTEWKELITVCDKFPENLKHSPTPPFAFTEHGVTMLANVLRSRKARQASILIVRAFIALKEFALNYKELSYKLQQLEEKYDQQFASITEAINYLLQKDKIEVEQKNRRRIGFKVSD